jgi:broad specificity phosphatase PhoE
VRAAHTLSERAPRVEYAERFGVVARYRSPDLNEINYGELGRMSKSWVMANVPEYKTDPQYVFPGGESFHAMQTRSVAYVLGLEARHRSDTLLLVVHAGVIRGLVCSLLDLGYGPNLKRKISHRYLGEFILENGRCPSYRELGRPSGFVREGVLPDVCAEPRGEPMRPAIKPVVTGPRAPDPPAFQRMR